ncbi:transposase [Escherichia coli]
MRRGKLAFLSQGLVRRGMHGLRMITSDDHSGLRAAIDAVFPGILWQRCQFHLQQNAHSYVTKKDEIPLIAAIFGRCSIRICQYSLCQIFEKGRIKQPSKRTALTSILARCLYICTFPDATVKGLSLRQQTVWFSLP